MPIAASYKATLCALSGVLYFLVFLFFELFPLAWICFVPALYAIRGATVRQALACGALFGLVTNAGGFYWIVHLIIEFGGAALPIAVLAYLLLCAYQGGLLALTLALVRLAERDLGVAPVWSLPIALAALEFTYPLLFPSFVGNSQYEFRPVTQIADVTGMLGLSALVGLINGAVYELIDSRRHGRSIEPPRVLVPAAMLLLSVGYGSVRLPQIDARTAAADTIRAAVIQTNIGGHQKEGDPQSFFRRHVQMSEDALETDPAIDLLVWPESVFDRYVPKLGNTVSQRVPLGLDKPVILGLLTVADADRNDVREYYNSVALVLPDGTVASVFDKTELVAFGETFPLVDSIPGLRNFFPLGFTSGTSFRHLQLGDISLLPMICYEDIIPSFVHRMWRRGGPPDVLVNVTNDSWYGDTHQPLIHLVLSSFRSIETRRALIRSTNTGISAVIDPAGRIVERTEQWTRDVLIAEVPLINDGSSTLYMRSGDVIGWTALGLTLTGVVGSIWKRRRRPMAIPL